MEQDLSATESKQKPSGCQRTTCIVLIAFGVIALVCVLALSGGGWMVITWATETAVAQTTGTAQAEATSDSGTAQFKATSESATATTRAQDRATSTAEAAATSTQEASELAAATSTAQVAQSTAGLPDARLEIYDPFESDGGWDTTQLVGEYADGVRYILDGVYTWQVTNSEGAFIDDSPEQVHYMDFYLSVDARKLKGPKNVGYGLLFRSSRDEFYAFEVVETQYLAFWSYYSEQWHALWYYYRIIAKQGEINTLAVQAQGNRFTLFVNGQKVRDIQDSRLESGSVGLFVDLPKTEDKTVVEFDNFTLLVP